MTEESLRRLKSGTDLRGVAIASDGKEITLSESTAELIARAFVLWLRKKTDKNNLRIAIGNDSRLTAEKLFSAFAKGATESGCDVFYTGLSSTPSMFMLITKMQSDIDASVMITASHLPADRNGFKFFTSEGGLESGDIDEIISLASKGEFIEGHGTITRGSFMDEYASALADRVRAACRSERPLSGMKIIVDAGNGAGGFFAEKVLEPLGADTDGSLYLEPDGNFPNHVPNPEDKNAISSLKEAVLSNKADLGIIFDTDVDRAGAVDSDGAEINRNRLIALLSALLLKKRRGTIVTDSVTSDGLTRFIEGLGGRHLRYKRGYKNVIDECKRLNRNGEYSPLAIETSGHAAFKDNFFLDDGAYLVTELLICLSEQIKKGKKLSDLIKGLEEPAEEAELRLPILERDFREYGQNVIQQVTECAKKKQELRLASDNYEGVRINFGKDCGNGWALIRMSLHDPILPVNIESAEKGGCKIIAEKVIELLSPYKQLNIQQLINFTLNQNN